MKCPKCAQDYVFNQDKPIVVMGVPCLDATLHYSILEQWNHISKNYRGVCVIVENTYVDIARNRIVMDGRELSKRSYGREPDYFLFIDSDTVIARRHPSGNGEHGRAPDYLDMMVARNVDICSGHYVKKRDPYSQIPVFGRGKTDHYFGYTMPKDRLLMVDWVGGGYLLVKNEVFTRMPGPWFENRNNGLPNGRAELVGEDIHFCRLAAKHGIPIFVDLNVRLGHYGSIAWPPEEKEINVYDTDPGNQRAIDEGRGDSDRRLQHEAPGGASLGEGTPSPTA